MIVFHIFTSHHVIFKVISPFPSSLAKYELSLRRCQGQGSGQTMTTHELPWQRIQHFRLYGRDLEARTVTWQHPPELPLLSLPFSPRPQVSELIGFWRPFAQRREIDRFYYLQRLVSYPRVSVWQVFLERGGCPYVFMDLSCFFPRLVLNRHGYSCS